MVWVEKKKLTKLVGFARGLGGFDCNTQVIQFPIQVKPNHLTPRPFDVAQGMLCASHLFSDSVI